MIKYLVNFLFFVSKSFHAYQGISFFKNVKNLKLLTVLPLILISVSCAQLKKEIEFTPFHFHKKWVRATVDNTYLGFRHLHRMTPILTPTMVIAANAVDGISAYDRKTGHRIWKLKIKFGVEAGGQLVDSHLYFGASDGYFYSVNSLTGQVNWSFPIRSESLGQPLVKGSLVYFLAGNNTLYALDRKSGQKKWLYARNEFKSLSVRGGSRPVAYGNTLYVGFSDGQLVAINSKSGQLKWEKQINDNRRFMDVDATPVIDKDRLYISGFDDELLCLRLSNGKTIWRVDSGGYNAVKIIGDKIVYPTTHKTILVLDRKSGKTLWSYPLAQGFATAAVTYKGLAIFGESEGGLKALDIQSKKLIMNFNPGRGIASKPVIDVKTGEVYFISRGANLFALQIQR